MSQAVLGQEGSPDGGRRVIEKFAPPYPELAQRLNLDGTVKLLVTVTPDGMATHSEVVGGSPLFAKAAQDAVRKWKWAPGPRETQEQVQLKFRPR